MSDVLIEVVFPAGSLREAGILGRDEIEDPIDEALTEAGLGEVSGGGSGTDSTIVDVSIDDADSLDAALHLLTRVLRENNAPVTTKLIVHTDDPPARTVYEPLRP